MSCKPQFQCKLNNSLVKCGEMEIDGLCQATTMSEILVSLTTYLCRPLLSVLDVKSVWGRGGIAANVLLYWIYSVYQSLQWFSFTNLFSASWPRYCTMQPRLTTLDPNLCDNDDTLKLLYIFDWPPALDLEIFLSRQKIFLGSCWETNSAQLMT